MPPLLSTHDIRLLRLRAQRLESRAPREALVDVVRSIVGINAQSIPAMQLALRARVAGLTLGDIDDAIHQRRLVRTWLMRGTLHLAAADDFGLLIGLLGPELIPGGRRRRLELGLDDETSARGLKALRFLLKRDGALTRTKIVERLNAQGVALDRKTQAPIHLIGLAALKGWLVYGADRDGKETFRLADSGLAMAADQASLELARRYAQGYGPASAQDFAAWSGLRMARARAAWGALAEQGEIIEARAVDETLWLTSLALAAFADSASPVVNLIPAFDTLILGYANRDLIVDPAYQAEVYHGGQTVPVVLIDGQAAGVWRYARQGKRLSISIRAFESFDAETRRLIGEEADDMGRLWETPVSLAWDR